MGQVLHRSATTTEAIRANSRTFIATGSVEVSEPVALTASGIKETLADYRRAAANAKEAGFDGVGIHAENGYLIDQFLRTGTNQRTYEYGGSASNRVHFLSEAVEQVLKYWDSKGSSEEDLALSAHPRTLWKGLYIVNGGYDGLREEEAVRIGHADAVAYARAFLANPDLPRRLLLGAALDEPDPKTFYGGDGTTNGRSAFCVAVLSVTIRLAYTGTTENERLSSSEKKTPADPSSAGRYLRAFAEEPSDEVIMQLEN